MGSENQGQDSDDGVAVCFQQPHRLRSRSHWIVELERVGRLTPKAGTTARSGSSHLRSLPCADVRQ